MRARLTYMGWVCIVQFRPFFEGGGRSYGNAKPDFARYVILFYTHIV